MKKRLPRLTSPRLVLEPRIVFDAAIAASVADQEENAVQTAPPAETEPEFLEADGAPGAAATQLIFIDAAAADVGAHLQGVQGEVIYLEADRDGVRQILEAIDGRTGITAIHLVSHGEPGEIRLGSTVLNENSVYSSAADLETIGMHLTAGADLLIYGCKVAQGAKGEQLLDALARFTGADVAASLDDTGAAGRGGDWELEATTGVVDTPPLEAPAFTGLLDGTITAPGSITVTEDTPTAIGAVSVQDTDGDVRRVRVAVGASGGWFTTNGGLGWTLAPGTWESAPRGEIGGYVTTVEFSFTAGNLSALNQTLSSIIYAPVENFTGTHSVTFTVLTEGYTTLATHSVGITIAAVDDPTVITGPERINVDSGATYIFGGADLITVSDVDTAVSVTYSANHGTVTGSGSSLTYTPDAGYSGLDELLVETFGEDGQTGWLKVEIVVYPSAPTDLGDPVAIRIDEDHGPFDFAQEGISIGFEDPDTSINGVMIAVQHGTLQVELSGAASILFDANGSSSMIINGSSADINNTLGSLVYTPEANYHGNDALNMATYVGSMRTAQQDVVEILIDSVQDPTIITGPTTRTFREDETNNGLKAIATSTTGYLAVSDGDTDEPMRFRVTAEHGTLTFLDTADVGIVEGVNSSKSWAISDTYAWIEDGEFKLRPADVSYYMNRILYTGDANYNGPDTVFFEVLVGDEVRAQHTINVTVTPRNDAPVASGESLNAIEDTPAYYEAADLLANDTDIDVGNQLSISAVTGSNGGTAVLGSDGRVTFTPWANHTGSASFTYTVTDGTAVSNAATATITIAAVDDPADFGPPFAIQLDENASFDFDAQGVPIQFTDVDSTITSVQVAVEEGTLAVDLTTALGTSITAGASGTASMTISGSAADLNMVLRSLVYTPLSGYAGGDAVQVTAFASGVQAGQAEFVINVVAVDDPGVNDTPFARDDTLNATENVEVTFAAADLLANDRDDDGDAITIASVTSGTGGTAVLNADGTVTFTPALNYNGLATFTYTVTDGTAISDPATVTVTVSSVDETPVANGESLNATEDAPAYYEAADLLANDTDADGDTLSISEITSSFGGVAVLGADGQVTFTPFADYAGPASFTYTVTDGTNISNEATATVTIAAIEDPTDFGPPFAVMLDENASFNFDAQGVPIQFNDVDSTITSVKVAVEQGTLAVDLGAALGVSVTGGANGTASMTISGSAAALNIVLRSLVYTPRTGYSGEDGLLVTTFASGMQAGQTEISIYVSAVDDPDTNDVPFARDDDLHATEDTEVTFSAADLLGNDRDDDGDAITIASVTSGTGGTVVLNGDGTVTFTPTANYAGAATFTYTVTDGTAISDPATATVTIAAVDDPTEFTPTFYAELAENTPYLYFAPSGFPIQFADVDSTITSVRIAVPHGTLIVDLATALGTSITAGANRTSSMTISGSAADLNTVLLSLWYTPRTGYTGADNLQVTTFASGVQTGQAGYAIDIRAVNDPGNDTPFARDDDLNATEDTEVTFAASDLLGNDRDDDGDAITIASVTSGTGGTVVLNADGSVTFTPTANYNGPATFTYTVTDGTTTSNTATVFVNVAAVDDPANDAPIARNDSLNAVEDTAVTFSAADLLGNDSDDDGDTITIASVTSGTGGTVVLNGDGTVTFTPAANYNGPANFTYTVTDGTITSSPATVIVSVAAVNDAPIARSDSLNAVEDTAVTFSAADLLGNDTDDDGDVLTIASVTSGTGGTVVLNGGGTVRFTPAANYNGPATFTYTVTDGSLTSNTATVTVNVAAVDDPTNDAPIARNDSLNAVEDTAVTFSAADLLGNDSDDDGDTITIASVTSGTGGTAVLNSDGSVTFTPAANYNGPATFTYTVTDGSLTSNTATVTVNVAAVDDPSNDAPIARNDSLNAVEDTAVTFSAADLLSNDTDDDGDTLTIASVTSGTGGTVVLNGDGTVTFTPAANYNGPATFTYTVTDGTTTSNTATVFVNVAAVDDPTNDAPIARNDSLNAVEDTAVTFSAADLLGNDTDDDGDTLTIASVTSGTGGTVVLNGDGTVTFTPAANYNGPATFTYTVTDGTITSSPATVTVSVAAVNDAPIARNDSLNAVEDTAVTFSAAELLGNDSDNDGGVLTIASITSGTGGTAVLNGDGTVTFTPAANYNGPATFTYTVTDGSLTSNTATVTVNVAAVDDPANDAPIARNDSLNAVEDTAVTFSAADLLGNDTDDDGDVLTIASVTSGTGGTVVLNGDGSVTFTPAANYNGPATFTYTVTDGSLTSNTATVTVNVAAVDDPTNDAPIARDDSLSAVEDTAVTFSAADLLGNDSDDDGDTLTIASVTSGTGGTVVLNADGTVTFTPAANYNGPATFTYTVTDGTTTSNTATVFVNVAAVDDPANDAPIARNDSLNAVEDTVVTFSAAALLGNDSDDDGDTLTIVSVTSGTGGTVVLNGDGTVTFTPAANYNGPATFTYTVTDGSLTSNTATVTVNVAAVDDPSNDAPIARNDSLNAVEDTVVTFSAADLLSNDTDDDGDALTIASVTSGTGGTVVLNGDGTVTFTPAANYNGPATFTYTVTDGTTTSNTATVTVNVAAVDDPTNDAPIARDDSLNAVEDTAVTYSAADLLGNDTDDDGDTLTIASVTSGTGGTVVLNGDGTVTFTPAANYNGPATFTYTVTDGSLTSNTATVTVNVTAVDDPTNDAPIARNDSLNAVEDTAVTYSAADLLGNDSDDDGDTLTIASVTSGTGGTVVLNGDGTVTFTPAANYNGPATFTYTVTDGSLTSNTATVTVNVTAVDDPTNDAPIARNDSLNAVEDMAVTYSAADLLGNDSDDDGDTLTIASVTSGTGGTVVLNGDGTVTFTPAANYNGPATFTYTITDGSLTSNTATVTVNVTAVDDPTNDAPIARNDSLNAVEDTAVAYSAADLLGNDSDDDGDALTIASVTSGTGGTVVLNGDGTVTFTPAANYNGPATFTYTVTDGTITSSPATVTVTVAAVNDAPIATNDNLNATKDTVVTYSAADLLGNDSDIDGNSLTIASVSSATGGTAILNGDGTVTFTPAASYTGVATFTYTVTDGSLTSNTATVSIAVAAVDNPPPVNAAPVHQLPSTDLSTSEDTTLRITGISVRDTDSDRLTTTLSVTNGTLSVGGGTGVSGDGTSSLVLVGSSEQINILLARLDYSPDGDYFGAATLSITTSDGRASDADTLTLNVAAITDAVDDSMVTRQGTAFTFDVLANDTFESAGREITAHTHPSHGTLVIGATGVATYTPGVGFVGSDSFTYTVTSGGVSETATVHITVAPGENPGGDDKPIAIQTSGHMTTAEDSPLAIGGIAVVDGKPDAVSIELKVSHGTLALGAANGASVSGSGTGHLVMTGTAADVNALLQHLVYASTADWNGNDTLTILASDGTNTASRDVTITVQAVRDAADDTATTQQGSPVTFNVLTGAGGAAADTFLDPNRTVTSITQPTGGHVTYAADGTMTFAPNAGFTGATTFTYTVSSGGGTEIATVTVNVKAAPDGETPTPTPAPDDDRPIDSPVSFTGDARNVDEALESGRDSSLTGVAAPGGVASGTSILDTLNASRVEIALLGVQADAVDTKLIVGASSPDFTLLPGDRINGSVQETVRDLQAEASLLSIKVHSASIDSVGSPLFDPIGLGLLRGAEQPLARIAAADAEVPARANVATTAATVMTAPDADVEIGANRAAPRAAAESQAEKSPAPRRSAPSFSEQLKMGSQALRTTGDRGLVRAATNKGSASARV